MNSPLPPWPTVDPSYGRVRLRAVQHADVAMAQELSSDPYVPLVSSLPADASTAQAEAWIERQRGRHAEGAGFSFTIADADTDIGLGHCGLWLDDLAAGRGRIGYSIVGSARGRGLAGDAVAALTTLAWTVPGLVRLEAFVEPWNVASVRTVEGAGFTCEGVRRHPTLDGAQHSGINDGERRDLLLFVLIKPGG